MCQYYTHITLLAHPFSFLDKKAMLEFGTPFQGLHYREGESS